MTPDWDQWLSEDQLCIMGAVDKDILVVGAWVGDHWQDISKAVLPDHNTEPLVALTLWLVAPPPCPKLLNHLCKGPE